MKRYYGFAGVGLALDLPDGEDFSEGRELPVFACEPRAGMTDVTVRIADRLIMPEGKIRAALPNMTEYDCGPISMMNAIIFLFDREQIPPDLIRNIMLYCLDGYGAEGAPGRSGTTRAAMMFLSNFLGSFGRTGQLDLSARYLSGSCVRVSQNSAITDCLRRGGAVVVRLYLLDDPHYILLTGVQGEKLCAFDPYLPEEPLPEKDIVMTDDHPYAYNRVIPFSYFNHTGRTQYALGETARREAVLLFNTHTELTEEQTVEYVI